MIRVLLRCDDLAPPEYRECPISKRKIEDEQAQETQVMPNDTRSTISFFSNFLRLLCPDQLFAMMGRRVLVDTGTRPLGATEFQLLVCMTDLP